MSGKSASLVNRPRRLDARTARTRAALLDAFGRLFLRRGLRLIPVGEVIAEAGVARSTFYDHYGSADELLLAALRSPLSGLADTAVGRGDPARLAPLLGHFWENRQRGRHILSGRLRARTENLFAEMVEERLESWEGVLPRRIAARQLADATLSPVRAWLAGEGSCSVDVMAAALDRAGKVLVRALAA